MRRTLGTAAALPRRAVRAVPGRVPPGDSGAPASGSACSGREAARGERPAAALRIQLRGAPVALCRLLLVPRGPFGGPAVWRLDDLGLVHRQTVTLHA